MRNIIHSNLLLVSLILASLSIFAAVFILARLNYFSDIMLFVAPVMIGFTAGWLLGTTVGAYRGYTRKR